MNLSKILFLDFIGIKLSLIYIYIYKDENNIFYNLK